MQTLAQMGSYGMQLAALACLALLSSLLFSANPGSSGIPTVAPVIASPSNATLIKSGTKITVNASAHTKSRCNVRSLEWV